MPATLLAIETSCDESAVALSVNGKIRENIVLSQDIHKVYGGVVPELASRAHEQHLNALVEQLLQQTKVRASELDAVAFTQGPGLLGALLVGCAWAKAFAWARGLPLIAVDHLHAHIMSHFIEEPKPAFPFLALLASGGHTQLRLVEGPLESQLLGQTQDDAVGEAFDKAANMLGLPYPGGPLLDKMARKGNPKAFALPKTEISGLNYSFSGLKTAFKYLLHEKNKKDPHFIKKNLPDLCASIEQALVETLMEKLEVAQKQTGLRIIGVAGGTAANTALRLALKKQAQAQGWQIFIPEPQYCTDNAAMVATAAHYLYKAKRFASLDVVPYARCNISLETEAHAS